MPSLHRLRTAALAALALHTPWAAAEDLRNWADDPFVQLSRDVADCPVPKGPLMTEKDWKAEAHWRIETGTSCWLAGKCADSNAYRYDAGLAKLLFPKLENPQALQGSSVWAFVQRRILFLQGCVRDEAQGAAIEALAKGTPDLVMVVPAFKVGAQGRVPYRPLDAP